MWRTAVDDVEDDVASTWNAACTGKTRKGRVRSEAVLGIGKSEVESKTRGQGHNGVESEPGVRRRVRRSQSESETL